MSSGSGCVDTRASRRTNTPITSRRAQRRIKRAPAVCECRGSTSWLEAQGSKKKALRETAPFPEAGTFKPSPRAWTI